MSVKTLEMNMLNYIDGVWTASQTGEVINSMNPANQSEIVGTIQRSSMEDLNAAIEAAKKALSKWKKVSPVKRGEFLHKAADLFEEKADEIAELATKEMGKAVKETKGEVLRGAAILRYYAQEGMRQMGEVLPSVNPDNMLYTKRVPVGVVGVIAPWNFPIAIPIWKIAPALIYGNTIIFKPAAETGLTGAKIAEVFEQAGLPAGVLNLVNGKGSVIGQGLVDHKDVNAITFTGSNEVGKQVASGAVVRGAKYQLEMGGKNPVIVLEDAALDHAVELTVMGAMKQTGQRCTATSRAYVHRLIYDEFKEKVLKKVQSLKIGNGLKEGTDMGPLASKAQMDTVLKYIEKGKEEGAVLLTGGNIPAGKAFTSGFYVEPTVFENVTRDMVIAREEIFGPVLCLIKVDSFEEAIEQANDTIYGLSASLFTSDLSKALTFVNEIDAGLIQINGETGGAEPQAPFGGMKASSSNSREQGQAAKEFFTSIKTVTMTPVCK
ncbi:alpha-ketoglutaric semialdehyde dehydrogenase GucD [Priestia abyssalis]|uniref:alpha-ketoglutaric semialdehyde dehydrogenase GucD n=1 Tax=Priestia abyssalis TaxID=1221450 RepID=UPI0009949E2F|nr:alpha-ketoglutaric semialdehyde dehydrogenase GucD [Priestia abyssalis]